MSTKIFTASEIRSLVEGNVFSGKTEIENRKIEKAFCSDLMSEVLTLLADNLLLITGLNNIQAVRTAEMSDISSILLVRGKRPTDRMVELAESHGIVLMTTSYSMYRTGGILYTAGLDYVY
ncbi:MAG: DRTGG domain-containing protein [Sediminispirochaetaceae bacterium]